MKLSTRTRYGSRAMVELARAYPGSIVSVKVMSRNQRLSAKYLEGIMVPLKAAGLVKAVRGPQGGYALTRSPSAIRLGDIFRVLEGSPAPVRCVDRANSCPMHARCPTRTTWVQLKRAIERVLDGTTLQNLVDRKGGTTGPCEATYEI